MPFKGHDPITTLIAVATKEPTPPRALRPDLPPPLNDLVMKLLAKDPAQRPTSARDVVQALRHIESELRGSVRPPVHEDTTEALPSGRAASTELIPSSRNMPEGKSGRWKVIGIAVGLAALIVASVLLLWPRPKGTVRIEFTSDSVTAVLDHDGKTVQGVDEVHEISVPPGYHQLTIKAAGFDFETRRFELKKGETVHLKVELLPDRIQVVHDGNVIGSKRYGDSPDPGWVNLFNGKDLSGWTVRGKDRWTVKEGVLNSEGADTGYLLSDRDYGDFELDLEYRLAPKGNSGVFLRASPDVPGYGEQFLEIQILDDKNPFQVGGAFKPNLATGSVFRYAGPARPAKAPAGEWNRMLIRMEGTQIEVSVNGDPITRANLNDFQDLFARSPGLAREKGRVGLQTWKSVVEFKNIRLRELKVSR
jgi:hypothetical protein